MRLIYQPVLTLHLHLHPDSVCAHVCVCEFYHPGWRLLSKESASGLLCINVCVCVCVCVFKVLVTTSYLFLFILTPSPLPPSTCGAELVKVCLWVGQCCDFSTVSVLRCVILSVQLCMTGGVCVCVCVGCVCGCVCVSVFWACRAALGWLICCEQCWGTLETAGRSDGHPSISKMSVSLAHTQTHTNVHTNTEQRAEQEALRWDRTVSERGWRGGESCMCVSRRNVCVGQVKNEDAVL